MESLLLGGSASHAIDLHGQANTRVKTEAAAAQEEARPGTGAPGATGPPARSIHCGQLSAKSKKMAIRL